MHCLRKSEHKRANRSETVAHNHHALQIKTPCFVCNEAAGQ